VRNGALANWGKGIVGKYLACDYPTGEKGSTNVITVLFPHNASHPKADFVRVDSGRILVRQRDVVDHLFESTGETLVSIAPGISAQARAGVIRLNQHLDLVHAWLMDGVRLISHGFELESSSPVILFREGNNLRLATKTDCRISLTQAGMVGVSVNGGEITSSSIVLPAGTHALKILITP
jgi:hypothetical protein